ncbi:AAEL002398-PA [Aedes aegypti]|uniref:AAEL002398-PA n=1 Tax=Aedes aegypti TaxID=7159 RepID=Q17ID5_AEDAE|nr:AAEL002398-PA [Aedes aegypti]
MDKGAHSLLPVCRWKTVVNCEFTGQLMHCDVTYINGKKSPKPAVESHDCIGIVKRYHLCNEQDCPDTTVDFREQQCTSFNNQTFQDKRYIWEAFIKDDAECELNCKPIGMRYFATLNKTVIDGTPCRKPTEYFRRNNSGRGICVDGICKLYHTFLAAETKHKIYIPIYL